MPCKPWRQVVVLGHARLHPHIYTHTPHLYVSLPMYVHTYTQLNKVLDFGTSVEERIGTLLDIP